MSSSSKCGGCGQKVGRNSGGVQCESCAVWFHGKCADIPKGTAAAFSGPGAFWKCKLCRSPESRRRSALLLPPSTVSSESLPHVATLDSVMDAIRELRADMKLMNCKHNDVVESIQFCSSKVSDFEGVLNELHKQFKLVEKVTAENVSLKKQMGELTARVSELEQYSRRSNLELQGVPQKNGEDLVKIVHTIGDSLGVALSPSDLDAIHRVPHGPGRAPNSNPKAIVMRFCSRMVRDRFLAAARLKRRSAPKGSGPGLAVDGVSTCFFINEHLTQANKILLGNTKRMAKERSYKYVWSRDCKIFVRKGDDSRPILIRCSDDIDKL